MHPAELLWNGHLEVDGYPDGCVQVPEPIRYTSFFPGGFGLWNPTRSDDLPHWPLGGVMVLGHDFHSENGYNESLRNGMESSEQPTWRELTRMLAEVAMPMESCFFTNFYMGLRKGTATTGRYPGSRSAAFVDRCRAFLRIQVEVQRPRLILTLGAWIPPLVAELEGGLENWRGAKTLRDIDRRSPLLENVMLHTGSPCVAAALSHPSFYPRSASARAFRGLEGPPAHEQLMREAVRAAGFI